VVDDEPEVLEVLVQYLEQKGFEALGAGGGEEALRRVREFRPQLVLVDLVMPGLSGMETLRRIKALSPETPVVIVSGNEDEEAARLTLAQGAADYLTKPIDFGYLDRVLELRLGPHP
jgi:DNA-binding response OmpR family regulator